MKTMRWEVSYDFGSTFHAYSSLAAVSPILAEFGIIAYLNNLNPFDFTITEGILGWDAVIGWRIATYYVPIAITWLLLVKLALSKIPKTENK